MFKKFLKLINIILLQVMVLVLVT